MDFGTSFEMLYKCWEYPLLLLREDMRHTIWYFVNSVINKEDGQHRKKYFPGDPKISHVQARPLTFLHVDEITGMKKTRSHRLISRQSNPWGPHLQLALTLKTEERKKKRKEARMEGGMGEGKDTSSKNSG